MDNETRFIVHQAEPLNGEPTPQTLRLYPRTPNDVFFIRSHGQTPSVETSAFRLRIGGAVAHPLALSLEDLRQFLRHTVAATLQCAGNRRHEMNALQPIPNEVMWQNEAVSHAEWGGVLLRDVLERASITEQARHIAFLGLDASSHAPEGFGGSVPLEVVLSAPVLLADTMNGQPLPPEHGYPLRVIVPGYIGARSVKWLSEITLQEQPSGNYYQQHGYRLFPAWAAPEKVESGDGIMLGEMPVNSTIWQPLAGESLVAGAVCVYGHAFVGGGRTIQRVDVSADGGSTWTQAQFTTEAQPYAWRLWEATLNLAPGACELVVRAWDSSVNTQPERVESIWNFKGYMNNAYHRVQVQVIEG